MRGTPFGEESSIENFVRILGVGILATLGVVLVLGYGRNLERITFLSSKYGFLLR